MKHIYKLIGGTVLGLSCLAMTARADLILSGSTAGYFQGSSSGSTVVSNSVDGSTAEYRTGIPVPGSFQSGVEFDNDTFAGIGNGDTFGFGMITYFNGRTLFGTSSADPLFDFYLDLSDPAMDPFLLTTVHFGIDATRNTSGGTTNDDFFTATFSQPTPVLIGDQWVKFMIDGLPASMQVDEDTWQQVGNVTVTYFSPVPEPSTYGLIGALGLIGLIGVSRFRSQRSSLPPASIA